MNNPSLYIHIDADAFFASVEQCLHKELKGKPVVTGRDASMVIAMSYEAKALGIERGIPIHLLHEQYPHVHMVSSDYQMYKIFSDRMFSIISQFLPDIQRTSVDECKGYFPSEISTFNEAIDLAQKIKNNLETKLGCTFSIGIARTPLLAKIASAMNKPSGLTAIETQEQLDTLYSLPIEKVPGFGRRMTPRLRNMGIGIIRQFVDRYPSIANNFSVPLRRIHQELIQIPSPYVVKKPVQSMNRARSFKVTDSYDELLGQLTINIEFLLRKLRNQKLSAQSVYVTLRDRERRSYTRHVRFLHTTCNHTEIYESCVRLFNGMYTKNIGYRYISVTLSGLVSNSLSQLDLFGESNINESHNRIWDAIDLVNRKLGASFVHTATSLLQPKALGSHLKSELIVSRYPLLPAETSWRRLRYPYLGMIS